MALSDMPCHQVLVVLVLERTCLLVVVKNGMRESVWCELLTKSTLLLLRLVVAGPVHIAGRIFSSSAPCVGGILDEGELNCPSHTEPKSTGEIQKGNKFCRPARSLEALGTQKTSIDRSFTLARGAQADLQAARHVLSIIVYALGQSTLHVRYPGYHGCRTRHQLRTCPSLLHSVHQTAMSVIQAASMMRYPGTFASSPNQMMGTRFRCPITWDIVEGPMWRGIYLRGLFALTGPVSLSSPPPWL